MSNGIPHSSLLLLYLTVLFVVGLYFAWREGKGTDEYFLAGGKMGWWAIAASTVKDLTFSANGDMYIATDRSVDPILLVYYITGTVTGMRPLYKNLITAAVGRLPWTGNILYERVMSSDPPIAAIDMGNSGAPYYGR